MAVGAGDVRVVGPGVGDGGVGRGGQDVGGGVGVVGGVGAGRVDPGRQGLGANPHQGVEGEGQVLDLAAIAVAGGDCDGLAAVGDDGLDQQEVDLLADQV